MQLGANARAALITRGLAEIIRFGVALGAQADTFAGLAGMGDLILTTTGNLSRNRQVGLLLAQGKTLDDILQNLGHVAEGVMTAHIVKQWSEKIGVDMPISKSVYDILSGNITPEIALDQLLHRDQKSESAYR
jgi:glycerol-3-phosphate dehydrogenase (NAD(P)+)